MPNDAHAVSRYYTVGRIMDSIRAGLSASGKDLGNLTPIDLAPVDAFHIRGRESTLELATRAAFEPDMRVLDVGCGLGGSVRHIAAEYGCRVTGLDLTSEYIDVAAQLSELVGLSEHVSFVPGSALELPFENATFDIVWTEHAQMNIADKPRFYGEIARVLAPGGALVFHDIFQGPAGPVHFPVPWADDDSISFLATPDQARAAITATGLRVADWVDTSDLSATWFRKTLDNVQQNGPPPLGLHLLIGSEAPRKLGNMLRNLEDRRVTVIQARAEKP